MSLPPLRLTLGRCALPSLLLGLAASVHTLPARANGVTSPMQFAVTESGQATVNIPIQVPRGIAGMEPHLALNYSSGAGNGLLGLGWTLSGVSAITRCPKSIQHDQVRGVIRFNTGDRYCLDGQRLLIVNKSNTDSEYHSVGAEYRTFPDSFSRITAVGTTNGAPTHFKVETKAGLTMEFGDTAAMVTAPATANSSRIEAVFDHSTFGSATNRWMLSTITDRFSNSIRFVYCKGRVSADSNTCTAGADWTGSAPLHYIHYTKALSGGPLMAVVFNYEDRPDAQAAFTYGAKVAQTQRLKSITTYMNFKSLTDRGTRIKHYALSYAPLEDAGKVSLRATRVSRLVQVQEFGETDAAKLPPLSFDYLSDAVFGKTVKLSPDGTGGSEKEDKSCGGFAQPGKPQQMCP